MSLPQSLQDKLLLPAIAAPMFLASGPELVVEVCRSGMIGTFPALNQRTSSGFARWLGEITTRLSETASAAPFGVNIIVHKSNNRLTADLELVVRHRVPLVITSLGAVRDVVEAVHSYGGLVFHDVINRRHAEKAADAGVDGLIAVCAGAGGHAGHMSPFALLGEIRSFFSGTLVLAGALSTGRDIAAARMMGADLAYMGTRFLATKEAMISEAQKHMILAARAADIICTPNISGVYGSFLRQSIINAGLDPDKLPPHGQLDLNDEARVWKTIWSAGQGVGQISEIPATADLCARLRAEFAEACLENQQDTFVRAALAAYINRF